MVRIPLCRPSIGPRERANVEEALRTGWLSGQGPFVERLERAWAARCSTHHAVATASGTAALHLTLLALGVTPGDEVLVPALTYAAVANAVRHAGAEPIVVDVDPATWCLSAPAAAAAITSRTVGIIAVHAYGHPVDLDAIAELRHRAGLWLVEDAAEAHLAAHRGRIVGGLADAAVFSFFGNKIVTTGEGGAVTTSDGVIADAVRALARQGVTESDDRFAPSLVGLGLRLGNLAAAVGCAQMERVDELVSRRCVLERAYLSALDAIGEIALQPEAPWAARSPWLVSILLRDPARRPEVLRALAAAGVETRTLFPSLAKGPAATRRAPTPEADHLAAAGLSLPLYPDLRESEVAYVVETVNQAVG